MKQHGFCLYFDFMGYLNWSLYLFFVLWVFVKMPVWRHKRFFFLCQCFLLSFRGLLRLAQMWNVSVGPTWYTSSLFAGSLKCHLWLPLGWQWMSNLKVVLPVNAQVVLKTTNVDGVYDEDPWHNPSARLLENLTYHEMTSKDLSVMDMTAITLCQENNVPGMSHNLHLDCSL